MRWMWVVLLWSLVIQKPWLHQRGIYPSYNGVRVWCVSVARSWAVQSLMVTLLHLIQALQGYALSCGLFYRTETWTATTQASITDSKKLLILKYLKPICFVELCIIIVSEMTRRIQHVFVLRESFCWLLSPPSRLWTADVRSLFALANLRN